MKLSLIVPALMLAIAGCASAPPPPAQPPAPPVEVAPPKPTTLDIDRAKFSITLPDGWVVKPGPAQVKGNVTQELVARSVDTLGAAPVIVAVMTVALDADDPKDEDFGPVVAVAALKSGAQVLMAEPADIDGKPGSAVMMVTPSGMLIIQQATAAKRTGFVVRCGGDASQGDKIIERCSTILPTFHIKK